MTLEESLEAMCRRCFNHEQCLGTGCAPKKKLEALVDNQSSSLWTEYELRNPYPNNYKHCIDNGHSMLECPECESRIISALFSHAVGDYGYRFCPYCGADLRKSNQMTFDDLLRGE